MIATRFLLLALAAVLVPTGVNAQQVRDGLSPREVVDPEYAVRVQLDRLAEMIRQGRIDRRRLEAPDLVAPVAETAAAATKRPRPHPEVGPLWDFTFELRSIRPAGEGRMVVHAYAYLASQKVLAPVVLEYAVGPDGQWRLEMHRGIHRECWPASRPRAGAVR
jgi:hypothetical protein